MDPKALHSDFNRHVDEFLAETFCQQNMLAEANVAAIERTFEEIDEQLASGNPPDNFETVRESYDRCKVLFCHILMELEMLNWRNSPEESLWDLRNRDEGTHIATAPSEGQAGIPLPEKFEDILHSSAPGTFEHDDHGLPEVSLPDADEESTGTWVPGGSDADVPGWQNESTDSSWQPSEEGSPEGSELWTGLEVGEEAPGSAYEAQDRIPEALWEEVDQAEETQLEIPAPKTEAPSPVAPRAEAPPPDATKPPEPPRFVPPEPPPAPSIPGAAAQKPETVSAPKVPEPPRMPPKALSVTDEEADAEEENWSEIQAAGEALISEAGSLAEQAATERGKEFLELAEFFRIHGEKGTSVCRDEHARRFRAQCLLFSIEVEIRARLQPALAAFWQHKQDSLHRLLDPSGSQFHFHPSLLHGLREHAQAHAQWLPEGKLPEWALLNSLRFLKALDSPRGFSPALIEGAALIFLFGQDCAIGGFPLRNQLGVKGLGETEMIEFFFRMLRLQHVRGQIFSPEHSIGEVATLEEDAHRLLVLMEKMALTGKGRAERVA